MNVTICDVCGEKILGNNYNQNTVGHVRFVISGFDDVCYYCACEIVNKSATDWQAEYNESVEGKRRLTRKKNNIIGDRDGLE